MKLLAAFILALLCPLLLPAQTNADELLPVKVNGLWGYMDERGRVVIQPQFQSAESFNGNLFAKVKQNGKPALISKSGKVTQLPISIQAQPLRENYLLIEQQGKLGVSDENLVTILPVEYNRIRYFENRTIPLWGNRIFNPTNEFIQVSYDTLWGLYDFEGTLILPQQFTYIFYNGKYFFTTNARAQKGVYNKAGEKVLPNEYDDISEYNKDIFGVKKNGLWGLYDTLGNEILSPVWQSIERVNNAWAYCAAKDSAGLVCLNTKQMLPRSLYTGYISYGSQKIILIKNSLQGLYNEVGKEILPINFTSFNTSDGYYYVGLNNKVGLYDSTGKQIVPPTYYYIDDVENNVALVLKNNRWGLINIRGQEIVTPKYNDIDLGDNSAKCKQGKRLDIYTLNSNGQVTEVVNYENVITIDVNGGPQWQNPGRNTQALPNTNQNIGQNTGNWFYDTAQKKWGRFDANGDTLIKPIYENITYTDTSLYTIVQLGTAMYTLNVAGFKVVFEGRKGLVREEDGKILVKPSMAFIDPVVLHRRGFVYARGLMLSGQYIIITLLGGRPLPNCRFMDAQYDGISRAFIGGIDNKPFEAGDSSRVSATTYIRTIGGTVNYDDNSKSPTLKDIDFKKGYWIYIDANGRRVDTKYTYADNFYHNRAIVGVGKYFGVINNKFRYVIEPHYNSIKHLPYSNHKQFLVQNFLAKEGYVDTLGDPVTGFNFHHVNNFSCGVGLVTNYTHDRKNKYYFYVDENGQKINNEEYKRANDFNEGIALVRRGKWYTHINQNGQEITEEYRSAGNFSGGRTWMKERNRFVVIDENGTKYTANTFLKITPFAHHRATAIIKGSKWVIIDDQANIVGETKYKRTKHFDTLGYCAVAKKRKWGLVDVQNKVVLPLKYSSISAPIQGKYILEKKKNYYLYMPANADAKPINLGKLRNVRVLDNGVVIAQKGKEMYTVDDEGNLTLLHNKPIAKRNLYNDLCIIGSGALLGAIDYNGDTILPIKYRGLKYLGQGLFFCQNPTSYTQGTIIDAKGIKVKADVNDALPFSNGFALVLKDKKWGIIDTYGVWVVEPKYDWISSFKNNFARAGISKSSFIADNNGQFITEANFEKISYERTALLYRVELGRKVGYFDPKGTWVWPPQQ